MSETDDEKTLMAELKAELIAKAEAAGVEIDKRWSADKIEAAVAAHALKDPTEPEGGPDERDVRIAELEQNNAILGMRVNSLLDEIRAMTGAPDQVEADTDTSAEEEASEEAFVLCRISKAGADKISDGKGGKYQWKDEVRLPASTANSLEGRGYVEIEE